MAEDAEELAIRNLVEALTRLREDLNRVELWTAALAHFQRPAPGYKPDNPYLLSGGRLDRLEL